MIIYILTRLIVAITIVYITHIAMETLIVAQLNATYNLEDQ